MSGAKKRFTALRFWKNCLSSDLRSFCSRNNTVKLYVATTMHSGDYSTNNGYLAIRSYGTRVYVLVEQAHSRSAKVAHSF